MNIGILGAGGIASTMAYTVSKMENVTLYAVGSRNLQKAQEFADKYGINKAYGSYEELVADKNIDLVYIATPHSHHYEHCKLCIAYGKNILCEKAFTVNKAQAEEIFALADEKGVFITEAMWTRFLPMKKTLDEIINSNVIGKITSLTANLGYSIEQVERLVNPALAGGALLDLGVYTINFALMAFGNDIESITSSCVKTKTGVDRQNSIIITFTDGKTATLHSNMCANTDRRGMIYGDKGRIEFTNINNCEGITVTLNDGTQTVYNTPKQISGYEYEVISALNAISNGKTECDEMPHCETLRVLDIMDKLRADWGIKYPFE